MVCLDNWTGDLFLNELTETVYGDEVGLKILVERGKVLDEIVPAIQIEEQVIEASPIVIDENLPIIQIEFESYVAYAVMNETYFPGDDYEIYDTRRIVSVLTQSRYLDFVNQTTFVEHMHPGEHYIHYRIQCLDHVIEVVSYDLPKISEIAR